MAARWAIAFAVATWLAIIGNAGLRSAARSARKWRDGEFWATQLRRLGGPVLVAATLVGTLFAPDLPRPLAIALIGAVVVGLVGILDERRSFPPWARFILTAGAAAIAVAGGVEGAVLGADLLDALFTAGWIVLVTTSFRRIDTTDGLAAALGGLSALGLFAVAADGQAALATVCVALGGACIGFLAYNVRPASVVMGPGGASFVGFVVAVGSVEITPDSTALGTVVVPTLIVALPVLDFSLVVVSRLWNGRSLHRSRRDHLIHRLVARGWPVGRAVGMLVAVQAVLVGAAALAGRDVVPALLALAIGVVALLTLGAGEQPEPSRRGERERPPDRTALKIAGGVFALVVLVCVVAGLQAFFSLRDGQKALEDALDAGRAGDIELAQVKFADAAEEFDSADTWIGGPLGWPGRLVPVLGENIRAAQELAEGGGDVARAGGDLARTANERIQFESGTVPVEEVRRFTPQMEEAADLVDDVAASISELRLSYLIGPVREGVEDAAEELAAAARESDNAVAAAQVAPAVFGADRDRTYFLAVQNPAELRGTGGIIGNWGILTASGGRVDLADFERTDLLNEDDGNLTDSERVLHAPSEYLNRYARFAPAQIWQNLNMTPDFPTLGRLVADLYPQSGGTAIDGVIGVDPVGLQSLLTLAGPVTVPNWPEPITAENVIDITLRQAYDVFEDRDERGEFLGDVAEAVWDHALEVDLGSPAHIADVLGDAGRGGHLTVWFTDAREQELARVLGIAGEVPEVESDSLLVTTQNAAANKVDYYLTRGLSYEVVMRPDDSGATAALEADVSLTLNNAAPSSGASVAAIGPWDERFVAGENRAFVSIYSPLFFSGATLDGAAIQMESARELGRSVYSTYVSIPSGASRTVALALEGTISLDDDGWYVLDLPRQPTLHDDAVTVDVKVPPAWEIVETDGMDLVSPRRAEAQISLGRTDQLRVRLAPA